MRSFVWDSIAAMLEVSPEQYKGMVIRSSFRSLAIIEDKLLNKACGRPWSLTHGNIMGKLQQLMEEEEEPVDLITQKMYTWLNKGFPIEKIRLACVLLGQCSWTSYMSEKLHASVAVVRRHHPDLSIQSLQLRAFAHSFNQFLRKSSREESQIKRLVKKKEATLARQTNRITGRHMYFARKCHEMAKANRMKGRNDAPMKAERVMKIAAEHWRHHSGRHRERYEKEAAEARRRKERELDDQYGDITGRMEMLSERILQNELKKGELATLGSKYWSDLRALYQGPDNMRKMIEIPEKTPIDKEVLTAIDASLRHPPNRALLLGLCRRKSEFHKGNALALMKMLTNVGASASSKQLQLGVELIECLHRMGAFTMLPDATSVLRPKLDSILLQVQWVKISIGFLVGIASFLHESYTSVIGSRMGPHHWLEAHRSIAGLVLPLASVDAVLKLEESATFKTVAEDLKLLVSGSSLGQKLFGWAGASIFAEQVSEIIAEEIATLASKGSITTQAVIECTGRCHSRISELAEAGSWMEKKRECKVHYADWSLTMTVSGIEEEIQLDVQFALRHWAVKGGFLTALVQGSEDVKITAIAKELYTKAAAARATALKLLAGEEQTGISAEIVLERVKM
eukprot:3117274-Amphidinium_carterae.1